MGSTTMPSMQCYTGERRGREGKGKREESTKAVRRPCACCEEAGGTNCVYFPHMQWSQRATLKICLSGAIKDDERREEEERGRGDMTEVWRTETCLVIASSQGGRDGGREGWREAGASCLPAYLTLSRTLRRPGGTVRLSLALPLRHKFGISIEAFPPRPRP